jgi:hypothetical protein
MHFKERKVEREKNGMILILFDSVWWLRVFFLVKKGTVFFFLKNRSFFNNKKYGIPSSNH